MDLRERSHETEWMDERRASPAELAVVLADLAALVAQLAVVTAEQAAPPAKLVPTGWVQRARRWT